MRIILRHVWTAIFFSFLITLSIVGVTLLAFPPADWSVLWKETLGDVPYWAIILFIPFIGGSISGILTGVYFRQRIYRVEGLLHDLIKQKKLPPGDEPFSELQRIREQLTEIEEKFRQQTEHVQRIATERANEREKSLQEIVVQERNRLARELHDSVSQQLFAASMLMSALTESEQVTDEHVNQQLKLVEKMIHQSQLEMRALLLHLRPVALKEKTLQAGAEELLKELTQKVPMEIEWKIEDFEADKGIEDQLFRILQESVSNTLRHAKANSLHVLLIERDQMVIMRVIDDGIGFDMSAVRASSYGLNNMRERAFEVGGSFKIISLPHEGTQLEVKVPLVKKEGDKP